MCRLIGIKGYSNLELENRSKILTEFFDLSKNGCVPKTISQGHSDGYGIVAYKNGSIIFYYRNSLPPYQDKNFPSILNSLSTLNADFVMGHLRKATKGENHATNNQPFILSDNSFGTNGTVHFPSLRDGENDSRLLFEKLLNENDVEKTLASLSTIDYTSATLLLFDGKEFTAARWFNEDNLNAQKFDFNCYYTLFVTGGDKIEIISSEITESIKNLNLESRLLENYSIYKTSF